MAHSFINFKGDDFDDSVITLTLQGQAAGFETTIDVTIIDDDMSEYEEVFLLVLRIVDSTDNVDIGRNVSIVRIRQDGDGK